MTLQVRSLALLSGLRIWRCRDLWYRSQTLLRSCVAVAGAGPIRPLAWESPHAVGVAQEMEKKKNHITIGIGFIFVYGVRTGCLIPVVLFFSFQYCFCYSGCFVVPYKF